MRKICLYSLLCLGLIGIYSCSQNQKRVQTFADTFVGYANGDQLDSIRAVYPTANFDSVAPLNSDSIQIAETDGVYHIDFGSTKWIEIKENEDGTFTIENSKGIAAFPEDKYNVAVNTGMLNDSISDTKAQELMNDSTYFAWLNDKAEESYKNAISIKDGKLSYGREVAPGASNVKKQVTLTNNTNSDIKKDDYEILCTTIISTGEYYEQYTKSTSGCDLKANESVTIPLQIKGISTIKNPRIKLKISLEEFVSKYYKPTGKEYQDYLESKK